MHLKQNCISDGNCAYAQKVTTSKVMEDSRNKVFDQMEAPVPEIMDSLYVAQNKTFLASIC
jgi:hypothetical protein